MPQTLFRLGLYTLKATVNIYSNILAGLLAGLLSLWPLPGQNTRQSRTSSCSQSCGLPQINTAAASRIQLRRERIQRRRRDIDKQPQDCYMCQLGSNHLESSVKIQIPSLRCQHACCATTFGAPAVVLMCMGILKCATDQPGTLQSFHICYN